MAPQPKGKQGSKGSKQIVEENEATVKFYRNMALGASGTYLVAAILLTGSWTWTTILMSMMSLAIHGGAFQFMAFVSRVKRSETGAILDTGTDLNMEGGISEHVKDLIILTAGVQLLALISSYFWLLFLLIPVRGGMLIWTPLIKPWLGQNKEQQSPEIDEKKQKKLDRRMKRAR